MREIRPSGSEGGARFKPWSLPLSEAPAALLIALVDAVAIPARNCAYTHASASAGWWPSATPPASPSTGRQKAGPAAISASPTPTWATRKAIEFHEQALVIVRELGDRRGEGNALWNSALALAQLGDRAQALARAAAALRIYEAIEDPNAAQVRAQLAQWRAAVSSGPAAEGSPRRNDWPGTALL